MSRFLLDAVIGLEKKKNTERDYRKAGQKEASSCILQAHVCVCALDATVGIKGATIGAPTGIPRLLRHA